MAVARAIVGALLFAAFALLVGSLLFKGVKAPQPPPSGPRPDPPPAPPRPSK